jgi:fatty acid desaturase
MHGLFFWTLITFGVIWFGTGFYIGLRHSRRSLIWRSGNVDISTRVAFLSVCTVAGFPMIVAIGALMVWNIASEAMRRR